MGDRTVKVDEVLAEARRGLPPRPTAADLPLLLARGAVVVDIRPAEQRARDGELAGAVVIDRNVLEWRLDPTSPHRIPEATDPALEIILVCNEGYASSLAAGSLQRLGLRGATDLDGGFQAVLSADAAQLNDPAVARPPDPCARKGEVLTSGHRLERGSGRKGGANMPDHRGFGHVTLTVTDLERSADFYNRVFSSQTVDASVDAIGPYAVCMGSNFMLGLRKHSSTPDGDGFQFSRVGLDHMGVHVEGAEDLEKWRAHLDEQGIASSGPVASSYGMHLHIKDPDGIATEFFAPKPQG